MNYKGIQVKLSKQAHAAHQQVLFHVDLCPQVGVRAISALSLALEAQPGLLLWGL